MKRALESTEAGELKPKLCRALTKIESKDNAMPALTRLREILRVFYDRSAITICHNDNNSAKLLDKLWRCS
jgi:hypothetical protein